MYSVQQNRSYDVITPLQRFKEPRFSALAECSNKFDVLLVVTSVSHLI